MITIPEHANVRLRSGSGDVALERLQGSVDARTGSGSIAVTGAPAAGWDLHAGSGDIAVQTPGDARFSLIARSPAGDIDAAAVTTERQTKNSLRGTVRGGGPLVSLETGSGQIRIR